jgi:hypothetical protein
VNVTLASFQKVSNRLPFVLKKHVGENRNGVGVKKGGRALWSEFEGVSSALNMITFSEELAIGKARKVKLVARPINQNCSMK